jgi:hypothetical protein
MIPKLNLRRFSLSEFFIGGLALAAIAVVTLMDLRVLPARGPSPVQLRGAPQRPDFSSTQLQHPFDQSRLEATRSINPRPSEPWHPGGTTGYPPLQGEGSADPASADFNIANATWNTAPGQISKQPTETVDSSKPELNPQNPSDAIWMQARLPDLGYFAGSRSDVWGPVSRRALRDFKTMNGLGEDDRWDKETEQRLSSKQVVPAGETIIGGWAEDVDQCRNGARLVISSRAAKVIGGECDFRSLKREAAAQWQAQAVCTDGGSSWNANISLKLTASKLIWTSERGTATYVRCVKSQTSSPSSGETVTPPLIQSLGEWLQGVSKLVSVHD